MRWRLAAAIAAVVVASACVEPPPPPPIPDPPSYRIAVTYVAPVTLTDPTPVVRTVAQGTITNTGAIAGYYRILVAAPTGETAEWRAHFVLPGQTAIWHAQFVGKVTIADIQVTAYASPGASPPSAVTKIISMGPTHHSYYGPATAVNGTLTNAGTNASSFVVELQADTGQVAGYATYFVPAGETVPWTAHFPGTVTTVRIVRTASANVVL